MQRIRLFYLLTGFSLLLTSCQAGAVTTNLEAPVISFLINESDNATSVDNSVIQTSNEGQLEESECLKCHSNKDLLIETAAPEVAHDESGSSGVG
jgi:hypothetical protein